MTNFNVQTDLSPGLTSSTKVAVEKTLPFKEHWLEKTINSFSAFGILMDHKCQNCFWCRHLDFRTHVSPNNGLHFFFQGLNLKLSTCFGVCSTCFVFSSRSQSMFFFTWGGLFFLNIMKIDLYIRIKTLISHKRQKCYQCRLISMFHLIFLEKCSFEFFCQGLKWRCCTFRWL